MRLLLPSVVALICLVLILPIAIVVTLSFSGQGFLEFPPRSYSLRWFEAFFASPGWRASMWSSVEIALVACVIATVAGFCAAYAFLRSEVRGKKLLLSAMLLPVIVPTVITSIAMYFASARIGLVGNPVWIGTCHAVVALPVVLLILLSALQAVDVNLERAALSLGASRLRVMLRIVLPIAAPGVASAALFGFLTSFDELVISLFLASASRPTLPVRIWNSLHLQIEQVIAAVSTLLIGVTAVVLLLDAALRRRQA